jgi:hypothetical protein
MRCTLFGGMQRTCRSAPVPLRARAVPREHALDALNEVVTMLRKNDLVSLRGVVSPVSERSSDRLKPASRLRELYEEGGTLVEFRDVFDLGSRRLLPSNLLRRSRVLSAFPSHEGGYMVRMSVTSKSGEEGTVLWTLDGDGKLVSCTECQGESADGGACTTVHPRHGPDSVLEGYRIAMGNKAYLSAQEFCYGSVYAGVELPRGEATSRFDPAYRKALEEIFEGPNASFSSIASGDEWVLGDGVLLEQTRMVRAVLIRVAPGTWCHWAFSLSVSPMNGCWMIDCVRPLI